MRLKEQTTCLGSICELVSSEVDLSKGALPDQAAEGVVPDGFEVLGREFTVDATTVSSGSCDG